jgi:TRAP-type C4-dicarboxylate transport system substrate-binding protein
MCKKIEPRLEDAIEKKGFVVLNWSDVGWVYFFSKEPARTPDDLRAMKLFISAGDPDAEKLYKELGFTPVPIGLDGLGTALVARRISAFDVPPLFALANQKMRVDIFSSITDPLFKLANNMIDMKWAPLRGATLVSLSTWKKIPESMRPKMLQVARNVAEEYRQEIRESGDKAISEMVEGGLNVVKLTDAEMALWYQEVDAAYPKIRGTLVPAELFDEVVHLSQEYLLSP